MNYIFKRALVVSALISSSVLAGEPAIWNIDPDNAKKMQVRDSEYKVVLSQDIKGRKSGIKSVSYKGDFFTVPKVDYDLTWDTPAVVVPEVKVIEPAQQAEGSKKSKIVISDPSSEDVISSEVDASVLPYSLEEVESKKAELREKGVYVVSQQLGEFLIKDRGIYTLWSATGSFFWSIVESLDGNGFSLCIQGYKSYILEEKELSEYPLKIQKDGSFHFAFINEEKAEVINFIIKNSSDHACDITKFKGIDQKILADRKSDFKVQALETLQKKAAVIQEKQKQPEEYDDNDGEEEEILYKPQKQVIEDLWGEDVQVLLHDKQMHYRSNKDYYEWFVDKDNKVTITNQKKPIGCIMQESSIKNPINIDRNGNIVVAFVHVKTNKITKLSVPRLKSDRCDLTKIDGFNQKSVKAYVRSLLKNDVGEFFSSLPKNERFLLVRKINDHSGILRWRLGTITKNGQDHKSIQVLNAKSRIIFEVTVEKNKKYHILCPTKGGVLKGRLFTDYNSQLIARMIFRDDEDKEILSPDDFSEEFINNVQFIAEEDKEVINKIHLSQKNRPIYRARDSIKLYYYYGIDQELNKVAFWKLDKKNIGYVLFLDKNNNLLQRCFIARNFVQLSAEGQLKVYVDGLKEFWTFKRHANDALDPAEYGFHPDYIGDAAPKPVASESAWKPSWKKQAGAKAAAPKPAASESAWKPSWKKQGEDKAVPLRQEPEVVNSDFGSSVYAVNEDIYEELNEECSWRVHKSKSDTIQFLDEDEEVIGTVKMQKLSSKPIILLQKSALPIVCAKTPGSPEILVSRYPGDKADLSNSEYFTQSL